MRQFALCGTLLFVATAAAAETPAISKAEMLKINEAVYKQVNRCWSPAPLRTAVGVGVRVRFKLDPAGSLTTVPEPSPISGLDYGEVAVAAAVRAVRQCAPYELPARAFEYWRNVEIKFVTPAPPPPDPAPDLPK